jgi:hypothetical protein
MITPLLPQQPPVCIIPHLRNQLTFAVPSYSCWHVIASGLPFLHFEYAIVVPFLRVWLAVVAMADAISVIVDALKTSILVPFYACGQILVTVKSAVNFVDGTHFLPLSNWFHMIKDG